MNVTGAVFGACCIAGSNAVLAALLTGIGLGLRRAFGLAKLELDDVFTAFWTGLGVVVLFAMLWNFAFPIGPVPAAIAALAGVGGLVWTKGEVLGALDEARLSRFAILAVAVFALWVGDLANGTMPNWDTSLYHMQVVEWARAFPLVPGLANLFGPLGFNNSIHLYDALLDLGPWEGRAWHVTNSALVTAFGAQLIASAARLHASGRAVPHHVFALSLLAFATSAALGNALPSFSTALPSTLLLLVAGLRAHRLCAGDSRDDGGRAFDLVVIAFLAVVSVSIKLSSAVFALLAVTLVSVAVRVSLRGSQPWLSRAQAWIAAGVLLVGGAWTTRGIVLSGYPLFPSPAFGFDVEWRVPDEHARAEFEFVVLSARAAVDDVEFASGESTGASKWLPGWWRSAVADPYELVVPAALTLGLGVLLAARARRVPRTASNSRRVVLWLLAPLATAATAWFLAAPMPHYGTGYFWLLAALLAAEVASTRAASPVAVRRLVLAGGLLGLSPCVVGPVWRSAMAGNGAGSLLSILEANLRVPERGRWLQTSHPTAEFESYTTRFGLALHVPTGETSRCWDAPIPCTPNPAPNLRLRVPGELASGFAVDGEWQMEHWPERWRPELLPALRRRWSRSDEAN